MRDGDELNHDGMDDDVLDALRRELSSARSAGPPPLDAIAAKARGHRRRRRSGLAGAGTAATAVAVAVALLATPGHPGTTNGGPGPVHVNLANFSVDGNADGTVRLSLSAKHAPDAPELASVLAQAGVPAVVRVGAFCGVTILPSGLDKAVTDVQGRSGSGVSQVAAKPGGGAFLISPSAIPKNAELSIGYSAGKVTVGLVAVDRPMTCVVSTAVKCAEIPSGGAAATTLPASTGTLPSAATTLPPAATTTLPSAAATTVSTPAASTTTLVPVGSSVPTVAVAPQGRTSWCEVEVLPLSAYAATTTSPPAAATTTSPPAASS